MSEEKRRQPQNGQVFLLLKKKEERKKEKERKKGERDNLHKRRLLRLYFGLAHLADFFKSQHVVGTGFQKHTFSVAAEVYKELETRSVPWS